MENDKKKTAPPKMNPYIFTILLFGFGLWCFYDGWLTTDPEMLEHATFNRVLSLILLPWGIYDFFKIRKEQKKKKK
jgi:hypothetical protein